MDTFSKYNNRISSITIVLSIFIIVLFSNSCGMKDNPYEKPKNSQQEEVQGKQLLEAKKESQLKKLEEYIVKLAVDGEFKVHENGELRVWIGTDDAEINFDEGMVQDEASIPADIGQFARITPFAPDFDISPEKTDCIKIHPSGSEVRFTLIPRSAGRFEVSANIELYHAADCAGPSVPKTAKTLTVEVSVDNKYIIKSKLKELGQIFWKNFIDFWGALIALLLAALLFLIRRKIKKKTGYTDTNE